MTDMISFSTTMLGSLADFLMEPPIVYLFALVLLCFIAKVIKIIIT